MCKTFVKLYEYEAVGKDAGVVVWSCGHHHKTEGKAFQCGNKKWRHNGRCASIWYSGGVRRHAINGIDPERLVWVDGVGEYSSIECRSEDGEHRCACPAYDVSRGRNHFRTMPWWTMRHDEEFIEVTTHLMKSRDLPDSGRRH